jgi:cytochrome c oxidase assembly protein subunit 15
MSRMIESTAGSNTIANQDAAPRGSGTARVTHALALAAAVFTWPLLLVGGTVTVHRVGMAVPDWPTTFGVNMFYYNMFEAPWGVFAEHSHRLYGSAVGLACLGLVGVFSLARLGVRGLIPLGVALLAAGVAMVNPRGDVGVLGWSMPRGLAGLAVLGLVGVVMSGWSAVVRRDRILALAWLALAAVVGQGVLGGFRVRLNSTALAFVHGWTGQFFFALLVVLWEVTSRRWSEAGRSPAIDAPLLRKASVLLGLVAAQVIVGGWVRHYGSVVGLGVHGLIALGVLAHVVLVARSIGPGNVALLRPLGVVSAANWVLVWSLAQWGLGLAATMVLWPFDGVPREVSAGPALVRVGHHGVGALLLASATVLAVRCWRHRASEFGQRVERSAAAGLNGLEVAS